jgi:hypothetical protein
VTDGSLILGMPLDVADEDIITTIQPLCGLVVVKGLDKNGEVVYCTAATSDLQLVECLGMAEYAVLKLKHGLTRNLGRGLTGVMARRITIPEDQLAGEIGFAVAYVVACNRLRAADLLAPPAAGLPGGVREPGRRHRSWPGPSRACRA